MLRGMSARKENVMLADPQYADLSERERCGDVWADVSA
jgi:hypothetical protein